MLQERRREKHTGGEEEKIFFDVSLAKCYFIFELRCRKKATLLFFPLSCGTREFLSSKKYINMHQPLQKKLIHSSQMKKNLKFILEKQSC